MTFGEMLKSKGISQSDCARQLGISRQIVNMYIKGVREPGPEIKDKIKEIYGYEFLKKNRVVFDHNEVIRGVGTELKGRDRDMWEKGIIDACKFYGGM